MFFSCAFFLFMFLYLELVLNENRIEPLLFLIPWLCSPNKCEENAANEW